MQFGYNSVFLLALVSLLHAAPSGIPNALRMELLDNQKTSLNSSGTLPGNATDANDSYNSINPDQYFIGGGDIFKVTIVGNASTSFTASINRQCELYIPELGIKKLGKICLTEAQKQIMEFVQTKVRKSNEVYIELIRVKKVTVSINGAVTNPGTYTFPGTYRILDALRLANNSIIPSMNDVDLRNVQCTTPDSTWTIDLFGYLLKNDMVCNPYLDPSENINIAPATRRVYVNAPTRSVVSGWIPIKENEPLSSFLSLLKFDASADTSTIVLQSSTSANTRFTKTIPTAESPSVVLQDRDIITIPLKKNYAPTILVSVGGEVEQPGSFPIIRDSATISDVLQMAGGPTRYADISRAVIVRWSKIEERTADSLRPTITSAAVRPEMNAGLSRMTISKDYSIVDIKNTGMSVKLYANDRIIVPAIDNSVYLSGNVKRAGAYPFVAGKPYIYYIGLAGGYTNKADRENVFGVRNYGNISQITDASEIRAADIIVIPDSQQAKFLTTVILPILQTAATIISVVLAVYSLSYTSR